MLKRRGLLVAVPVALTLLGAGCTAPTSPGAAGDPGRMLLADGFEPESLNPLLGYGQEGAAKFYDGLLAFDGGSALRPALAAEAPQPSPDARSWTVRLREGVTFHDGTPFDAEDVVATYRAAVGPAYASTVSSDFSMLGDVRALDPRTVRFDLKIPYAAWPSKLVLGIVPAEKLARPAPLENSELNTRPVGTGPYRLVEWRQGDQMTWEANPAYWGGAPAVGKVTVVFAEDDNTRAQRLRSGEFDGTVLPPVLAQSVGVDGYETVHHRTADFRTIALPNEHPVTGDRAVRLALNHAVNREGMIRALLGGHGTPAHAPIPESMPRFHEPAARFGFDQQRARAILDAAGWVPGPDGVRSRGGQRAAFTVMYFADDSLRKDLALAFASDARAVGIEVTPAGVDRSAVAGRLATDGIVLGGGNPIDPDPQMYSALHSSVIGTGTYNNPGHYRNAEVDAALDGGRQATDPARRAEFYKAAQRAYAADPGLVYLAFIDHSYVMRAGRWDGYRPPVEPHTHGTTWGPWWNLETWKPRP
ncbi:peptide/nickel transport system substrate-binding protein [Saccharopolyspora erythraea NRRL 2338]|uniref:Substrate-binding transport protein n=2 Tax=Saccharopolyspora erythraea TaxID=1836 RepID=A4FLP9_SACEN|nr:ABC transporter substrate-binding protein [Saccharopolyspora erythraea]EQD88138.1 transporter [Saccharopolyspora erythraea D]PFG98611.1 peptide/nickel transport system substrate-binding protein [Saccharopolyspora erythraea NRRL 2338]QRK88648.1 ABC transporter substrate-binding protein [Saccharopolyspora erythraea]CAM04974.1 putative substrate-binding transport protein [Saccharopolyspora erythraea NRRL 2338]